MVHTIKMGDTVRFDDAPEWWWRIVKPLEWIKGKKPDFSGNVFWRGQTAFDWGYRIYSEDDKYVLRDQNLDFANLEDAQAAAQADYERRIRSALSPAPAMAGWRKVLEALRKLTNEADGLSFREAEIKAIVGNTNWRNLRSRIEEARNLLASPAPAPAADAGEFEGTVDSDNRLQAAAREAGWALSELVDSIAWEKREQVSDIISRLGLALREPPAVAQPSPSPQEAPAEAAGVCERCEDTGYYERTSGGVWTGESLKSRLEICDCACGDDIRREATGGVVGSKKALHVKAQK